MTVKNAGVYVMREPEIVGVDNELLQRLKNVQLDGKELLRIRPEVPE